MQNLTKYRRELDLYIVSVIMFIIVQAQKGAIHNLFQGFEDKADT